MWARFSALSSRNSGPAADDLDLVGDVGLEGRLQVERPGHPVHQGHHVDPEAGLQRGVLVQVVEHHVGVGVALEADDELGVVAGREVVEAADAVELPAVDELGDALLHRLHARLVGQLGDHDLLAGPGLLDLGPGPDLDGAPPGAVGVHDPGAAEDVGAGREVGSLDEVHQVVGGGVGVVDQVHRGIDHLAQVVGRDVGGHADGDPLAAVDQQVREPGGEDGRLLLLVGVVGHPVDGVLVDALQHVHGQQAEPALGVALGRGREVRRAVVAVEVDQGMAQAEGLGHADQGVVDGLVAVGVEAAHGVAADLGALHVRAVGPVALDVHVVEDPAVDRLQPVAGVGQGPADDDRHGVVQEGPLHLVLDLDRLDRAVGQAGGSRCRRLRHRRRRRRAGPADQ